MKLPFAAFLASFAALFFAIGVAVGAYELFPYQYIKFAMNSVEAVLADRDRLLEGRPVGLLGDRRYEGCRTDVSGTDFDVRFLRRLARAETGPFRWQHRAGVARCLQPAFP